MNYWNVFVISVHQKKYTGEKCLISELSALNSVVSAYLEFAEMQARRLVEESPCINSTWR